ncbi:MAG: hypothetical protein ACTSRZ_14755 [Promethearchaeota archaeon]
MAKKQKCPYCGNYYVYLNRHKCPLAPKGNNESSNELHNKKANIQNQNNSSLSSSSNTVRKTITNKNSKSRKRRSYSKIDKQVLKLVSQENEIYFDVISEQLDINPKILERSLRRLEQKHKITFEYDIIQGVRKEKVKFIKEYEISNNNSIISKNGQVEWETLGDCPCFLCPNTDKCNPGHTEFSPIKCEHIHEWIQCSLSNTPYKSPYYKYYEEKKKKKEEIVN